MRASVMVVGNRPVVGVVTGVTNSSGSWPGSSESDPSSPDSSPLESAFFAVLALIVDGAVLGLVSSSSELSSDEDSSLSLLLPSFAFLGVSLTCAVLGFSSSEDSSEDSSDESSEAAAA